MAYITLRGDGGKGDWPEMRGGWLGWSILLGSEILAYQDRKKWAAFQKLKEADCAAGVFESGFTQELGLNLPWNMGKSQSMGGISEQENGLSKKNKADLEQSLLPSTAVLWSVKKMDWRGGHTWETEGGRSGRESKATPSGQEQGSRLKRTSSRRSLLDWAPHAWCRGWTRESEQERAVGWPWGDVQDAARGEDPNGRTGSSRQGRGGPRGWEKRIKEGCRGWSLGGWLRVTRLNLAQQTRF